MSDPACYGKQRKLRLQYVDTVCIRLFFLTNKQLVNGKGKLNRSPHGPVHSPLPQGLYSRSS